MTEEHEKKWPEYVYWSALPVVLLLALVVGIPNVEAAQDSYTVMVVGGLGSTADVLVTHDYPDNQVLPGESFTISATAAADSANFPLTLSLASLSGDCVENTRTDLHSAARVHSLRVLVDMTGPGQCTWTYQIVVKDQQTTTVYESFLAGTVASYELHDLGQDSSSSLSASGLAFSSNAPWLLLFGTLLIFSLWYGRGLVWLLPIVASTIGFFSTIFGSTFPVQPTGALTLYVLALLLVWYQSRKLERSVK